MHKHRMLRCSHAHTYLTESLPGGKPHAYTHTYTDVAEQKNRVERGKRGRREKKRAKNAEVTFGAEKDREERVRKR